MIKALYAFVTRRPCRGLDAARNVAAPPPLPRVLFLDDDPKRAEVFLERYPHAVWVETAAECIARLAEPWDEVHLDHDLGGEVYVDMERDDCGMEVVRWLCAEPRPHLARVRFQIHSHNQAAAFVMGWELTSCGYAAEILPFGEPPPIATPVAEGLADAPSFKSLVRRVRRLLSRRGTPGPDSEGETSTEVGS